MRNWGIDWRKVPSSVWVLAGVLVVGTVLAYARASVPARPLVVGLFFVFAWLYLLLKGIRWLWFLTLVLYLLTVPWIIIGSVGWENVVLTILGLLFLVLPSTRGYFEVGSKPWSS
jgi:hypothetical protein